MKIVDYLKRNFMSDTYNKIFALFFVIFIITNFYISSQNSFASDEGTHAVVSLFYRDLVLNIDKIGFDIQNVYTFGMNYMAHYPKLQVTYPPIWHLTNGLIMYSVFGINEFAAKMTTLFFSSASMIVFYIFLRRFFNGNIALFSVFLFFINPLSLLYSYRALIDFSSWFFIFAALLSYFEAEKTGKNKYYLLTGLLAFFAVMGQRPAIILLPAIFIYSFFVKKEFKKSNLMLIPFFLLLIPYTIVLWETGGISINLSVVQTAGLEQGEPSLLTFENWIWYLMMFIQITGPISFALIAGLIAYIYKRKRYWKFFLVWVIVFWIGLSIPQNKESRFYQMLLLPAYIAFSYFVFDIGRRYNFKVYIPVAFLVVVYIFTAYSFVSNEIGYYPVNKVVDLIYPEMQGNLAVISERGNIYSSEYIFLFAAYDINKTRFVFRPCAFFGMSGREIAKTFADNNIEYVVAVNNGNWDWSGNETLEEAMPYLSHVKNFGDIDLYKVTNFELNNNKIPCNKICLTNQTLCPTSISPFEMLK